MNWNDVLSHELTPTPIPKFSWEKYVGFKKGVQISPADLLVDFEPCKKIIEFREAKEEKKQQHVQEAAQKVIIRERVIEKKGIYPFLFWTLVGAIGIGLAIAFLGGWNFGAIGQAFIDGWNSLVGGLA